MNRGCFLTLLVCGFACGKNQAVAEAPEPVVDAARVELPFELTYDRFGGMASGSSQLELSPLLVLYRNGRAEIGGQVGEPPIEVSLSQTQEARLEQLIGRQPVLGSFDWKDVHKQIGVAGTDRVSVLIEIKSEKTKQSAWIYAFEQLSAAQSGFADKLTHAKTIPGFVRFSEVASELDALRSELLATHNAKTFGTTR